MAVIAVASPHVENQSLDDADCNLIDLFSTAQTLTISSPISPLGSHSLIDSPRDSESEHTHPMDHKAEIRQAPLLHLYCLQITFIFFLLLLQPHCRQREQRSRVPTRQTGPRGPQQPR